MRRTISNLSLELGVSRPRIYRAMDKLGMEKKGGNELTIEEWKTLKNELSVTTDANSKKKADVTKIERAGQVGTKRAGYKNSRKKKIKDMDTSTLAERLMFAKEEYDYNKDLITIFQEEIHAYVADTGKTTMMSHNGSETSIPAITNLKQYLQMNVALSKLITELENALDMGNGVDEGVYG